MSDSFFHVDVGP